MTMEDWRGNSYKEQELGKPCDKCGKPAVRNCCEAEGDIGRTHWHGEVHTKEGILALCRKCADKENAKRKK